MGESNNGIRWWRWRVKTADGGFKSAPGWEYVETDAAGIEDLVAEQRMEHDYNLLYRGVETEPVAAPPREWLVEHAWTARRLAAHHIAKAERYDALARESCARCAASRGPRWRLRARPTRPRCERAQGAAAPILRRQDVTELEKLALDSIRFPVHYDALG